MTTLLSVKNLSIYHGETTLVQHLDLHLAAGECLAIVGESGSGKTLTARTIVGLLPQGLEKQADSFEIFGKNFLSASEKAWRKVRGDRIGFIVQDALAALDPLRKVADEVTEALQIHGRLDRKQRFLKAEELLTGQQITHAAIKVRQYPGQLSGGQRQRALIASVLSTEPNIIIADEPTASLDSELAREQLETLKTLKEAGYAILLISHDLSAVEGLADRVMVLQNGKVVESGFTRNVLTSPQVAYTHELVTAARRFQLNFRPEYPQLAEPRPEGRQNTDTADVDGNTDRDVFVTASEPAVLEVRNVSKTFRGQTTPAVNNVRLQLFAGESLGIAGPSGSGKSTLARILLAIESPDEGDVFLNGQPWTAVSEQHRKRFRQQIQWIPQDPYASFNPRYRAHRVLTEALKTANRKSGEAIELANSVGLTQEHLNRNTVRLSGGQRQRLAIARSLALNPSILVMDEAVSALDVSIQTQIIDLLRRLQHERNLSMFFISHDLGVLQDSTDRLIILDQGGIVEVGKTETVLQNPQHPVTQKLVHNASRIR